MFIASAHVHKTPRPEVIEGILREGQIATLCGPFSSGKSPVLKDWAVSVAAGLPWCGMNTTPHPVVMLDYESGEGEFYNGLCAIATRRVGASTPLDITVYLRDTSDEDPNSVAAQNALGAPLAHRLKWVESLLIAHPNALCIIDPIQILFNIDKNKSSEVTALFSAFRVFRKQFPGASFVFVFNLKKDGGDSTNKRPPLIEYPHDWLESISGSLDLQNRSDVRIGMELLTKGERDSFVLNGIRRGETFEPFVLEIEYLPETEEGQEPPKAGFKRVEASSLDLRQVFTSKMFEAWMAVDATFTVRDLMLHTTNGTAYRVVERARRYKLVRETGKGVYEKL